MKKAILEDMLTVGKKAGLKSFEQVSITTSATIIFLMLCLGVAIFYWVLDSIQIPHVPASTKLVLF